MFTSFDHHTTYIVCMLTATPITFSLACLYTTTICACILTALYHRMTYIQPGCSYHSLLFIHSFVSTQQPYAPAYSRHSTTIPYICSLYAHESTCHLCYVLFVCIYTTTICACILTTFDHRTTYMQPECSMYRLSCFTR